uniref:Uncharacterized protein n=1 Tax=Oryctolagus cuniculus TaxID=9986 RepID=A0A5F9C807_RABIT
MCNKECIWGLQNGDLDEMKYYMSKGEDLNQTLEDAMNTSEATNKQAINTLLQWWIHGQITHDSHYCLLVTICHLLL